MRTHLRWIIPLVIAVVILVGAAQIAANITRFADPNDPSSAALAALLALGFLVLTFVVPLILVIVAIVQARTVYRLARHTGVDTSRRRNWRSQTRRSAGEKCGKRPWTSASRC